MVGLGVLVVIAIGVWTTALNPRAQDGAGASPSVTFIPKPAIEPITFAAVGDSVTAGDSPDFTAGQVGPLSWVSYASGHGVRFEGGWAVGGTTTETMATSATPVDATVLVIVAGTNDVSQGLSFQQTESHLKAIATGVGIQDVIVSSIPPKDDDVKGPAEYNSKLQAFAESQGWTFVDAMDGVRRGSHYIEGYTLDGVHPTAEAARIIGESLRAAIVELGSD